MPHLKSFRRDAHNIHFQIRLDDQYWPTVHKIIRRFGNTARYTEGKREFTIPNTDREKAKFAAMFPEDWEIIQATNADHITFT